MERPDNINMDAPDTKRGGERLESKEIKPNESAGSNFQLMDRLCAKFHEFVKAKNITALTPMLEQVRAMPTSMVIMFVKQNLVSKRNAMRGIIREQLAALKATADEQDIDKAARFLEAMIEVSEA
jgi:hypothetical protein